MQVKQAEKKKPYFLPTFANKGFHLVWMFKCDVPHIGSMHLDVVPTA